MNLLKQPILQIQRERYLSVLIIIAPLLNFLSGINIDLYAPSLPAIANHYHISMMMVKNTITVTMIGFAMGCVFFGVLIDIIGRRTVVLLGLSLFILVSILALVVNDIYQLMAIRFVQGIAVSTASLGARTLVVDNFTGKNFSIAIVYTSVGYSLGPIISPFIGGLLQYHFGWQANFIAYAVSGLMLIVLFGLFARESLKKAQTFSFICTLKQYQQVLKNKTFMTGVAILVGVYIEQLLYPTIGPFIVENVLHHTPVVYGNTALLVGCSYLLGALSNRALINRLSQKQLIQLGFTILVFGVLVQLCVALLLPINLFTLMLPITVINFGLGFIFPNVLSVCLKLFPDKAGIASSVQIFSLTLMCSIGIFVISYFNIIHLIGLTVIYVIVALWQLMLCFLFFKRAF